MIRTCFLISLAFLSFSNVLLSQDSDLVKVFLDTRIVNGHSVELDNEGVMKFIIEHRFGSVNGGIQEFYGLDNSTIRMGFDYSVKNWLGIGIGRSSFEKTVDGFVKVKFLSQGSRKLSLTLLTDMSINTSDFPDEKRKNFFTSRVSYAHQILVAKKVNDDLSLQLMPSIVHRNIVATVGDNNDIYSIGLAGRYKLSKMLALSTEYYYVPDGQLSSEFKNSLALGLEIDTKGHVFQLHFGNSIGMIEKFFITETRGDWSKGDVKFGFNITRNFKVKSRKY